MSEDRANSAAGPERARAVRRVLLVEGAVNGLVLVVKLAVGIATGSLAILGDALHSGLDVANNVLAWFVMRIAHSPPDPDHPYGHRKFETLAVFGLASLLTVTAFELALRAMTGEVHPVGVGPWSLALMLGVLGVNVELSLWQAAQARRFDSEILRADALHTGGDALTSLVVIVGWQLAGRGLPWLDPVLAVAVAGLIFWLAFGLFKRAIPVLVDEGSIEPELLSSAVREVHGVIGVERVRSRWIGSVPAVDVVVTVAPELSTVAGHRIADAIEALLEERFAVHDVSVHLEPSGRTW